MRLQLAVVVQTLEQTVRLWRTIGYGPIADSAIGQVTQAKKVSPISPEAKPRAILVIFCECDLWPILGGGGSVRQSHCQGRMLMSEIYLRLPDGHILNPF